MYGDLLPIGSVVLLKGANKRVMICGRIQARAGCDKVYDYSACWYPEGITAPDQITDEMILADEVGYSARHWINYSDSSSCEVSWGSLSGVRRLKTLPGTEARTVSLQYSQQTPGEYRVVLILPNETVVDLKEGENTMDLPEGTTWLAVAAAGSEGAFTVEW